MIPTSLGAVAEAVGGRLDGGADPGTPVVAPAVLDSRSVVPGCLFVALPGEHVDGADYAPAAVAAGAVAALAARPVGAPAVVVDDVVGALGRLARAVVDRLDATVVGVTGSSGKTSTKDLLAGLLPRLGPTVAPLGSWNNEIGHPLTVLRADPATRFLVLECSARDVGHIAALCRIAPPQVGLVLNVGSAHLGIFGSREKVAAAKGELVEALPPDGLAVLNADDPLVVAMRDRTAARSVTFGRSPAADVRVADVRLDDRGRPSFRLRTPVGEAAVRLALHGEHAVENAAAAGAVALELGLPLADVPAGLAAARPVSRWRMAVTDRADGVTVVNDAYNANPESMAASLRALAAMGNPAHGRPRRTWAVLGEMAELGPASDAAHATVGRLAADLGVRRVVAVGSPAARIAAAARAAGADARPVPDQAAAAALLAAEVAPGDVILVKASRAVGLERLAAALLEPGPGRTRAATGTGEGAAT